MTLTASSARTSPVAWEGTSGAVRRDAMSDRLAEIEATLATARHRGHHTLAAHLRDLLAVEKAARALDRMPIIDATVVVPQVDGVVEMPLTWGYLLADLRAALANLEGGASDSDSASRSRSPWEGGSR